MKILLVTNPATPEGKDSFCREFALHATKRNHQCQIAPDSSNSIDADIVIINGALEQSLTIAQKAGIPTALRLIELPTKVDIFQTAKKLFVPSQFLRNALQERGVEENKISVVPYAYDQVGVSQVALVTMRAARNPGFGIVCAGNINSEYLPGLETIFAAIAHLRINCHLNVIGEGPELLALKKIAERFMIAPRVSFFGELSLQKKMEYFRAARAFVLPSGLLGFPWLALYAMSEGCPVIGPCEGSVPELVRNNENGLLYQPGDADGLAEQIMNLSTTNGLSLKLIAAGIQTVEKHSWDSTCEAVLGILGL